MKRGGLNEDLEGTQRSADSSLDPNRSRVEFGKNQYRKVVGKPLINIANGRQTDPEELQISKKAR